MGLTKTPWISKHLRAIREQFAPGLGMRGFARLGGLNENTYLSWESKGAAPGVLKLEAFYKAVPATANLAEPLARWAHEGTGEMPSGAGAGRARAPAEPTLVPAIVLQLRAAVDELPLDSQTRLAPLLRQLTVAVCGRGSRCSSPRRPTAA